MNFKIKQLTGKKHRVANKQANIVKNKLANPPPRHMLWHGDVLNLLTSLPRRRIFDLVVTSPPYNLQKPYEPQKRDIASYIEWQSMIIQEIIPRLSPTGSICWQVGNFIENGQIEPLDYLLHPIFRNAGLKLRNRIIWRFGHGLHCKRRFSGRYEIVLWYTANDKYTFNLDNVRIPSKYPGKRSYKGPNIGQLSSNPMGKNPEDVWDIPNVKGNHQEKTIHPCQFPVGLVERLVLALTKPRQLVFDPFCGVGSSGIASAVHGRDFWGAELLEKYICIAKTRIDDAINGNATYRPHDKIIYDHTKSSLSRQPQS